VSIQAQKDSWRRAAIRSIGARTGWVDRITPRPLYPWENKVSIYRRLDVLQGESGWVRRNSSPDRPARSGSLYNYASPTALSKKEPCRNPCISDYSTVHWARSSSVLVPSASCRSFRNASYSLITLQQRRNQPLPPNFQNVWVAMGSPLSTVITCDS